MLSARSRLLAVPGLVLGLVLAFASPASANATAFWGYWQAHGSTWAFAQTGPASTHPKDGDVEGWRFARSSGDTGVPPRGAPAFGAVCGSAAAPAGDKRVAVVIDYGAAADAPTGGAPPVARTACAVVPQGATGADVLAKVARPQSDKSGLICAIDASGTCAAAAPAPTASSSATPAAKPQRSAGSKVVSVAIGLLLVAAAGVSMMAVRRRAKQ